MLSDPHTKNHQTVGSRRRILIGILLTAAVLFLLVLNPFTRSLLVMSVYSREEESRSLEASEGFSVRIPGGLHTLRSDWYPLMMTFTDDSEFSTWLGKPARLTILYNFPAYDPKTLASRLYEPSSPYYSSFYGAYLVQENGGSYGFREDGSVDAEAVCRIPEFDYFELVLDDFGLRKADQSYRAEVTSLTEGVSLAGTGGWTRIEAGLTVNGCAHTASGFTGSYLQYGIPVGTSTAPFAPAALKGIVYAKYFEEYHTSIFVYAVCQGQQELEDCDRSFLQQTRITARS